MEIKAGDDGAGAQPVDQNGIDELFRRALRKLAVEGVFDDGAEADGLENTCLQRRRRQAEDRRFRAEDGTGMRFEGQHQCRYAARLGQFQRTVQNGAVAAMHTIEIADRDDAAAQAFRQRLLFSLR